MNPCSLEIHYNKSVMHFYWYCIQLYHDQCVVCVRLRSDHEVQKSSDGKYAHPTYVITF